MKKTFILFLGFAIVIGLSGCTTEEVKIEPAINVEPPVNTIQEENTHSNIEEPPTAEDLAALKILDEINEMESAKILEDLKKAEQ